MKLFLPILMLCLCCISCGEVETDGATEQVAPAPAPAPISYKADLPSIPLDKLEYLYENCDLIDYLFFNLPISMNQSKTEDIQAAIAHVAASVPKRPSSCQPIGQIFYEVQGNTAMRANLYFAEGCVYFEFLEDGKPAYVNQMMPQGIEFFNLTLNRVGVPKIQVE